MKHSNIALFVAHVGCLNMCSFCNQHIISGKEKTATPEDVREAVRVALEHGCKGGQLAFFGGSFTAIDRAYMVELLSAAKPFVDDGSLSGIRVSTRPDAIDDEVLDILSHYGVEAIELGAQSMVDDVLLANRRGHTSEDVRCAAKLIRAHGFELGLQMMTGLYKDTDEGAIYTAEELTKLKPDTMRIYPTVILEGTELADLYRAGNYVPQTLDEAVSLCAKLLLFFEEQGIRVIRTGLHSGGNVEDGYIAGAYHPAFRELCESEIYFSRVKEVFASKPQGKYKIFVSSKEISKMTGQKRKNVIKLKDTGFDCTVHGADNLKKYDFYIEDD